VIETVLQRNFKSPADLYASFKKAFESDLLFSFLLKKPDFIKFCGKYFGFRLKQPEPTQEEANP
jgi:hypothetical protein